MVKAKYPEDVKDFLTESLNTWVPFFTHILDLPLPENKEDPALRGLITIKTQVLRVSFVLSSPNRSANIPRPW